MKIGCKALTRAWLQSVVLHETSAHDGPLYQPWLGLYTAISPAANPASVRADLTEATFTGYARVQIASPYSGPSDDGGTTVELLGPLVVWTPSDAVTPNSIIGMAWFDASTAGNLLGLDPFDTPVPLPDSTSSVKVVPRLVLDYDADYGAAVVIP